LAREDFSMYNIPFGIGCHAGETFACTRFEDTVIHLYNWASTGFFGNLIADVEVFRKPVLNDFIRLGKSVTKEVRTRIQHAIAADPSLSSLPAGVSVPADQVEMLMPLHIGDYTDFYSSLEHASNVGRMFRDPQNPLLPNWRHLPVGYHGRASSIVISGTPVRRPKGQTLPKGADAPVFGPTKRLDFELEMAFVIGKDTAMGESIPTSKAEEYIFGLMLFNDWSARDIQQWEYVPLGPFLAKNFASAVSPWIVTLEALEPFRVAGPDQEPEVLPYLRFSGEKNYDIELEVSIAPDQQEESVICRSNFRHMYWNMCQQLAHHTCNGCNVQVGDLMASGTISGPDTGSWGSMLEITTGGQFPVDLGGGVQRSFVEDGDTVIMRAFAQKDAIRVGFGEVRNTVLPAIQD
jgi:fumarylacetoacetase